MNWKTAAAFALGFAALTVGPAHPQDASEASAQKFLNIHAMGFAPDGFSASINNSWDVGMYGTPDAPCANASVNLPNGAVIKKLVMWVRASATGYPTIQLIRTRLQTGDRQKIADFATKDHSDTRKAFDIPLRPKMTTVDNSLFWYSVGVCVKDTSNFYGIRIIY
jgi:hypothetical protein